MAVRISDLPDATELSFDDSFLVCDRTDQNNIITRQLTFDRLIYNINNFGVLNYNTVQGNVEELDNLLSTRIDTLSASTTTRFEKMIELELHHGLSTGTLFVENLSAGVPQ